MGFKIFAPVVETTISAAPEVEKCCVVGAHDTVNGVGQVAIAFVIPKGNADKEKIEKDIMDCCEKQFPNYSYPQRIIFKDEFPYTSAGKVNYRKLEEMCNI